jgi:tRNA A37 methylthiotransferase MiaB
LNYLHIFPFSPMEGTKASQYPPVPNHIVMRRVRRMRELNRRLKLDYRERMRNTVWDAVVVQEDSSVCQTLTDNFLKVSIDRQPGLKKRMIRIRIKGIIDENRCRGEWV